MPARVVNHHGAAAVDVLLQHEAVAHHLRGAVVTNDVVEKVAGLNIGGNKKKNERLGNDLDGIMAPGFQI